MAETKTLACKYSGCRNHHTLTDTEIGVGILPKSSELIGVKTFERPKIVIFGPGYTVIQIIGSSHLALSTWPEDGEVSFTAEVYKGSRPYRAIHYLMKQLDAETCQVTEVRYFNSGNRVLKRTLRR